MNVQQLLAEVEHLDEDALTQLKLQITQRENDLRAPQNPRTAEEWAAVVNHFLDDFWADTSLEEQNQIIEAIRLKNILSDQEG